MSLRSQFLTGLKWTVIGRFATQVVTWAITIYVMRLVAPDQYGLMALASIFSSFFGLLSEIGLGSALVRTKDVSDRQLRQIFGIVLLSNIVVLALMTMVAAPLASAFFESPDLLPVIQVIALQFVPAAFAVVPSALLAREMSFGGRAIVDFSASLGGSLLTLGMAYYGYGVYALAWGSIAIAVIRAIGLNFLVRPVGMPIFEFSGCGEMFHFGRNVAQHQFVWFFYSQADSFIVGKMLGGHALGIYSISMELASLPAARISAVLNQVGTPALSKVHREGGKVGSYLLKGMRTLSLFAFPVMWGISCVAPELVKTLLGQTWEEAIVPLAMICLMMPLRVLSVFVAGGLQSVGRADVGFRNICTTAIVMCIAFIVAYRYGLVALSLSWVFVFPIVFFWNLHRSSPHLEVPTRALIATMLPSLLCSTVMYGAVAATRYISTLSSLENLVLLILTGAVSYGLAAWVVNRQGLLEVLNIVRGRTA